jgi:hypothetical protein
MVQEKEASILKSSANRMKYEKTVLQERGIRITQQQ